jgi:hypothetical protein
MLPIPYFHITVTVPAELREVLRANQRDGHGVLMQATAAAIIKLARDPRYVGGTVAVLAVLHTWTQQLNLFRDIFPAARCVLLICFLSTTNTPQLAAGIFYLASACPLPGQWRRDL